MSDPSSDTIEIRYSPLTLGALVMAAALLTIFSAFVAFRLLPGVEPDGFQEAAGWFGLVLFSLMTAYCAWKVATTKGPIVTLTRTGIRDTRVSAQEIPWSAVRGVATKRMKRTKYLVLDVDPAVEPRLGLTRMARWSRPMNRRLGIDGLTIAAQGLAISHERLKQLCEGRAKSL